MRRSDVSTPALLVDIDVLDRNIALMQGRAAALGVKLRPHAKAHKCVEIAQRIMAAGAIGISCATIGEAEAMALGGIGGILVTAPLSRPTRCTAWAGFFSAKPISPSSPIIRPPSPSSRQWRRRPGEYWTWWST